MRHLAAIVSLPLMLELTPAQQRLPEVESVVLACGFVVPPPETLAQWRERADLVIRVRIESQFAFEHVRSELTTDIVTLHEAEVLDVIKGHPRAVAAGAVQQFLQMGGRIARPDHVETQTWNGFPIMPVGTEWVLFLEWNTALSGFTLFYREHGAVQVVDGTVITRQGLLHEWNGRPLVEFLTALTR